MRNSCLPIMIYYSICHKTSLIISSFFLVLLHSSYPKHIFLWGLGIEENFEKEGVEFLGSLSKRGGGYFQREDCPCICQVTTRKYCGFKKPVDIGSWYLTQLLFKATVLLKNCFKVYNRAQF